MTFMRSPVQVGADVDDYSVYIQKQGNPRAGGTLFTYRPWDVDSGLRQIKADRQILTEYWTDRGFVPENALQIAVAPFDVQANMVNINNIFYSSEAQIGNGVWVSPPADAAAQPGETGDYTYSTNANYQYQ